MYRVARDWGIQPSEFWGMTVAEWLEEAGGKIEQVERMPIKGRKKLSLVDVKRLEADSLLSRADWKKKHGSRG